MKAFTRSLAATTLMLGLVACGSTEASPVVGDDEVTLTPTSHTETIETDTGIYSTTVTTEAGTTVECVYIILAEPGARAGGSGISCNWEEANLASSQ